MVLQLKLCVYIHVHYIGMLLNKEQVNSMTQISFNYTVSSFSYS